MNTEVNLESLEGMSFADYKKALKKDKKLLKKAKGVLFINDHKFSDGKKALAMMIFKKPKEVKDSFKELKSKGTPSPKMAGGSCQLVKGENGPEFKYDIKLGGLKSEKIEAKGKSIFKSLIGIIPQFVEDMALIAQTAAIEDEDMMEENMDHDSSGDDDGGDNASADDQASQLNQLKTMIKDVAAQFKEKVKAVVVPAIKDKTAKEEHLNITEVVKDKIEEMKALVEESSAEVQDRVKAHVDKILALAPQLEKVKTALERLLGSDSTDKSANSDEASDEAAKLIELSDQTLKDGQKELNAELNQRELNDLQDRILSRFGQIFGRIDYLRDEDERKEVEAHNRKNQDAFEKDFEAKTPVLSSEAEDLKQQSDEIKKEGLAELNAELNQRELSDLQDRILSRFGQIYGAAEYLHEEQERAAVNNHARANQDEFEKAFENKEVVLSQEAQDLIKESETVKNDGLRELNAELSQAELNDLQDRILTRFGRIFGSADYFSDENEKQAIQEKNRANQDEFEKAWGNHQPTLSTEAQDLISRSDTILEEAKNELNKALSQTQLDQLQDKTLSTFGRIFGGLDYLSVDAERDQVKDHNTKNQDEFNALFEAKQPSAEVSDDATNTNDHNAEAAEELKQRSDALKTEGLAELNAALNQRELKALQDRILSSFGQIFGEIEYLKNELQEAVNQYNRANQDEFEKAWEAKQPVLSSEAEALKKESEEIKNDGLKELNAELSQRELNDLQDRILTRFGRIFGELEYFSDENEKEEVKSVNQANQDEFDKAWNNHKPTLSSEALDLQTQADQIKEDGIKELNADLDQRALDDLQDRILSRFGQIYGRAEYLSEVSERTAVMDYCRAAQDEFEKVFNAKDAVLSEEAQKLLEQSSNVLAEGKTLLGNGISDAAQLAEVQDKILSQFGQIFEAANYLSAVTEREQVSAENSKNQDQFNALFTASSNMLSAAAADSMKAVDELVNNALARLSEELSLAEIQEIKQQTTEAINQLRTEQLSKLTDFDKNVVNPYFQAKISQFNSLVMAKENSPTKDVAIFDKKLDELTAEIKDAMNKELSLTEVTALQQESLGKLDKLFNEHSANLNAMSKAQVQMSIARKKSELISLFVQKMATAKAE
jgi:hypothetical protein